MPALLLAGVFILAKVAIIWPVNSLKQVLNLLTVTGEDLVAAMLFGLVAGAALWVIQRNAGKRAWLSRLSNQTGPWRNRLFPFTGSTTRRSTVR